VNPGPVLALGLLLAVPPAGEPLPVALQAAVDKAVAEWRAASGVPGLSVAVALDGELRFAGGEGFADLENEVPATADTVYRLASIAKPITAIAALQLTEAGRLNLDADVRRYVPAFPRKPWVITTRQLLAHLGGVRHYRDGEFGSDPVDGRPFVENTRRFSSLLEALDLFKYDPLVAEPGTRFNYTTHGYTLAGCVVEAASGQRFLAYVRRRIFEPAGMASTRDDDGEAVITHRAMGYRKTANGELRNSTLADTTYKVSGGGLVASAGDLARLGVAVLEDRLLRPDTRRAAFTPQRTTSGRSVAYGLGWATGERTGHREIWHTGGQARVNTVLYLRPDQRLVIVVLTNLEDSGPLGLARRLADLVRP
jgi:serine beta-lactamase-like protein LACTB, mitochondrial